MKNIAQLEKMPEIKNNERTMVMLECETSATDYNSKPMVKLIAFLSSLGFDVVQDEEHIDAIVINGIPLEVDFSAAPTMGKNAFHKRHAPRQKREIKICRYSRYSNEPPLFIVPINKPTDKLRLIKKIEAGLKEKRDRHAEVEKRVKDREEFLTALLSRYIAIVPGCKSVFVEKGVFQLQISDFGCITIDDKGEITQ